MFDFKQKTNNPPVGGMSAGSGFGKNQPLTAGPASASSKLSFTPADISGVKVKTMPEKFLAASGVKVESSIGVKKSSLNKTIILWVIIGVLVIGSLVLGGFFLLKSIEVPQGQVVEDQNKIVTPESNEQTNIQSTCSAENCEVCNQEECAYLNTSCHLVDICQETGPISTSTLSCPAYVCRSGAALQQPITPEEEEGGKELVAGKDTDTDGLSDIEEGLWGSDPLKEDTDGDSYLDGEEIKNLYSPLVVGANSKLINTGAVKTYTNNQYGYSLAYPANWTQSLLNETGEEVIFTSQTGEFVEVIIQENEEDLTAQDWYLEQNPTVNSADLEEVLIGNWSGVKSPDKLNVYLSRASRIYILSYNVGLKTELNYATTFEMMLKSLKLFETVE